MKIIKPHKKVSREVNIQYIDDVIRDSLPMIDICINPSKEFKIMLALGHSQVEEKDPLKFFVTNERELIINPVIIKHTNHTVDSLEGCASYPNEPNIIVQRYNKCEVEYYIVDEQNKLIKKEESISGQRAKMFQHEIDHFNGIYIYDEK